MKLTVADVDIYLENEGNGRMTRICNNSNYVIEIQNNSHTDPKTINKSSSSVDMRAENVNSASADSLLYKEAVDRIISIVTDNDLINFVMYRALTFKLLRKICFVHIEENDDIINKIESMRKAATEFTELECLLKYVIKEPDYWNKFSIEKVIDGLKNVWCK